MFYAVTMIHTYVDCVMFCYFALNDKIRVTDISVKKMNYNYNTAHLDILDIHTYLHSQCLHAYLP